MRSKLRDQKVKPPPGSGIHKCYHPRCLTYPFLQDDQTKYTFSATKVERNIPGALNCKARNLTYLIHCKNAKKTVYWGDQTPTQRTLWQGLRRRRGWGALAPPPPPALFCKNKNKLNKKQFNKNNGAKNSKAPLIRK